MLAIIRNEQHNSSYLDGFCIRKAKIRLLSSGSKAKLSGRNYSGTDVWINW